MDANTITISLPASVERLGPEDFETASVHSAAPSYSSEAPSYHSNFPTTEAIPAYTPPPRQANILEPQSMVSQALPPHSQLRTNSEPALGLPPVPSSLPTRRHSDGTPDLQMFRIPLWSSISSNPNSRLYQRVAARRVTAASTPTAAVEGIKKIVLGRIDEDGAEERFRPLEDPYLVGEVAARKARAERLARENGDDILMREDKRWDWFLGQMKDVDERNLRWKEFRREMQHTGRLGRISRHLRG